MHDAPASEGARQRSGEAVVVNEGEGSGLLVAMHPDVAWPSSHACPSCRQGRGGRSIPAFIEGNNAAHTHSVALIAHSDTGTSEGSTTSNSGGSSIVQVNLTSRRFSKRAPCSFRADAVIVWDEAAVLRHLSSAYWDASGLWTRHPHRIALDRATTALAATTTATAEELGERKGGVSGLVAWVVRTIGPYVVYFVALRMCIVWTVLLTCMASNSKDKQEEPLLDKTEEGGLVARLLQRIHGLPSALRRWARTLAVRAQVACCPSRLLGEASAVPSTPSTYPAASLTRTSSSNSLLRSSNNNSYNGSSINSSSNGGVVHSGGGNATPKSGHPKDIV
jgi:hypothetical protein